MQNIVSEVLGYHKVAARWVPQQLTDEHKRKRVECATECVRRYEEEGEDFLDSIVTGDCRRNLGTSLHPRNKGTVKIVASLGLAVAEKV